MGIREGDSGGLFGRMGVDGSDDCCEDGAFCGEDVLAWRVDEPGCWEEDPWEWELEAWELMELILRGLASHWEVANDWDSAGSPGCQSWVIRQNGMSEAAANTDNGYRCLVAQ